jgi:16S rRNA C967 or C1407 C5-methylase (RsmB/RsmF family)
MQVFMVERSLKGIPMDALAAAQKKAIETSQQLSRDGTAVRYIRTTFVPEEGCCMCLFAAERLEDVKRVNELAQIPFDRIVPALDLTP